MDVYCQTKKWLRVVRICIFVSKSLMRGGDLDPCLLDTTLNLILKCYLAETENTSFSIFLFFCVLSSGLNLKNKTCFGAASKNFFLKWV